MPFIAQQTPTASLNASWATLPLLPWVFSSSTPCFLHNLLPGHLLCNLSTRSKNLYERDFFLGTPGSLNLSQSATITATSSEQPQACSLLFNGIAAQLKFPGSDPQHVQGTCSDSLNANCVADLQDQAKSMLSSILHDSSSSKDRKNSTS